MDTSASAPQAVNRILNIVKNAAGQNTVIFDVVMTKEFPLEKEVYNKITGLYRMGDYGKVEFIKNDDLLFMKRNGQLTAGLKYIGNNTFEGGIGFPKVTFELLVNGETNAIVVSRNNTYSGQKYLKYSE